MSYFPSLNGAVSVADPDAPSHVIKPNADGSINVNGTTTPGTLGQQTMANSAPVVIASNQSNLPANIAATGGNTLVADDAAAGTTVPIPVGGVYVSTPPTYTNGDRTQLQFTSSGQLMTALSTSGGTPVAVGPVSADALSASSSSLTVRAPVYVYNGATWDRQRGNTVGTVVIPPLGWAYAAASGGITNTTVAVTIRASAGAGLRNYLHSIQISTDALGAATELAIRDGAGGTVLWRTKLQTAELQTTTIVFDTPLAGTAATLLEIVTLTATVTGGVYVNAQGFAAP